MVFIAPQNPPGERSDTDISTMPDLQEPSADHFRSKEIFDKLEALLEADGAAMVAKVKGVYLFRVKAGKDGAEGAAGPVLAMPKRQDIKQLLVEDPRDGAGSRGGAER